MPVAVSSAEVDTLVRVAWIVLIPVGVLLALVLYQTLCLLQSVTELAAMARYEVLPALKDLREVAAHTQVLSKQAVTGLETAKQAGPMLGRKVSEGVQVVQGALCGLLKSI